MSKSTRDMRSYWEEAATENAAWYVDTSLDFDSPDMDQFWSQGERIVEIAIDEAPAVGPAVHEQAVEIGSGLGRNCKALKERFERVVGVDISAEMVKRATELLDPDGLEFVQVDGASLGPVENASTDLVMSFTVFQHIPDPRVIEGYIAEAGRVLRPGGVLAFQWNNQPGHRRWVVRRTILSAMQSTGLRTDARGRNAPQFLGSRVPLRRIERALDGAGLDLVATKGLGSLFAWAWARKR